MNKYTIKEQNGENALVKNDKFVICPFTPPYPVQNSMGGVAMQVTACNTICPHAKLKDNAYTITCGCKEVVFNIEGAEKHTDGKIISLSNGL